MNVLDIGANAGFYTLAFASLVGASGHVWAIEPFADNVRNLNLHLALNEVSNVTIIQCAVSNRNGIAAFKAHESNSMGKLVDHATSLLVPTVSIDSLVETLMLCPDLVKLDIEGGELAALRGATGLLERRSTTWLIALDDRSKAPECLQLLIEKGYSIHEFHAGEIIAVPGPSPLFLTPET
jgi:FkbM family methyltransferase